MRILQKLLENEGWGGKEEGRNGSEWKILTAGFKRGNMMDSYEYCMIWTQEGDHPRRTRCSWWILICKPDLQREMQQRGPYFSFNLLFLQVSSVQISSSSKTQFTLSNYTHKNTRLTACEMCVQKWNKKSEKNWQTSWCSVFTINNSFSPDGTEKARLCQERCVK